MIVSEKKLENARMELQIEVPVDRIEKEYEKVFKDFQKNAKIDGFRKGKVPLDIIKKRYQANVDVEVVESIIDSAYKDALIEKKLYPVGKPDIDFDNKFDKSKPFKFNVKFDVSPTIEIGDYKNIAIKENECTITDADIDAEVLRLRERFATVSKKAEEEKVEKGNYIRAELRRIDNIEEDKIDTIEPARISIIVGKDTTDYSMDEDVVGMKINEQKEVVKKYPKDYLEKELAGQKVKYLLKIIEINTLTLPEPDDEFAKDMGNFATMDDVRKQIRTDFENFVKEKTKSLADSDLVEKIIEGSKFDIPESMIISEMENVKSKIAYNMGMPPEKLEELFAKGTLKKDEYLKNIREKAVNNIKSTLVYLEVAKLENIKISEDKYKEFVNSYSEKYNKKIAEVERMIEKNGSKENIEIELTINSASEFLYKNASIKKQKPLSFEEFRKL